MVSLDWKKIDSLIKSRSDSIPVNNLLDLVSTGDKNAVSRVARMYRDGVIFTKDVNLAIDMMRECVSEVPWAHIELSNMLIKRGRESDYEEAVQLLSKFGDENSMMILGKLYRDGSGVKQDLNRSVELLTVASEKVPWAKIELAESLLKRNRDQDINDAISILKSQNTGHAHYRLARIYHDLFDRHDLYLAILHMRKSPDELNHRRVLAQYLLETKSLVYIKEGLDILAGNGYEGDYRSDIILANSYKRGAVVERDLNKAVFWAKKAYDTKHSIENLIFLHKCFFERGRIEDHEKIISNIAIYRKNKLSPDYFVQSCIYLSKEDLAIKLLNDCPDDDHKFQLLFDLTAEERYLDCIKNKDKEALRRKYSKYQQHKLHRITTSSEASVMYISSDEYAKYTLVSMSSLLINHPDRAMHFYILTYGVSEENLVLLKSVSNVHVSVDVIVINEKIFEDFNFPVRGLWTTMGLIRLVPHLFLPSSVNILLSLGADVIVDSNIDEVFDIDLGENYIAGTTTSYECDMLLSNHGDGRNSVNGDFIIYDLKKFRDNAINFNSYSSVLRSNDATEEQYLAHLFSKNMIMIDYSIYNYRIGVKNIVKKHLNNDIVFTNPKVVQYSSFPKPWTLFYNEHEPVPDALKAIISQDYLALSKIWWKYAETCEHYKKLLGEMHLARANILISVNKTNIELLKENCHSCSQLMHVLSCVYLNGNEGVTKSYEKAVYWMRSAASSNRLYLVDLIYILCLNPDSNKNEISNIVNSLDDNEIDNLSSALNTKSIQDDTKMFMALISERRNRST